MILGTPVFVAEIPRGGTRWAQANFHHDNFERFFGFGGRSGDEAEILIQHVRGDGLVESVERRAPVRVQSRNFRVELGAAADKEYVVSTGDDRPIVVFVRVDERAFRYRLLMDGDEGYGAVLTLLGPRGSGAPRMRDLVTDVATLLRTWPEAPLELVPQEYESPEL